ncbi:unnamed protein product [Arctia plantaginis]|uniref:Uncharacterized protein n=1 Tax=Arctia plantaginis TaxID=874455 RepID=A0A8S1A1D0_ARCPL|nr:unnamed protein product [Arctia plantaginis]CAB3240198.1 unnamed protein product [Arctia plantaginis]
MAKVVVVFSLMVLISSFVEGRDWQFQSIKRLKRGFNGGSGKLGSYGRSEEDASLSREALNACSGEINKSDSRELLEYNRDGRSNDNHHGHRSFSKASASASASAYNQNHNYAA